MFPFRRHTAATVVTRPDPRLRAAPSTVPLWARPDAALRRRFLAPGTPVHIYESNYHRSMMTPRFAYSVPCEVRVDSPMGTAVQVGRRLTFFLDRDLPWLVIPVAEDPAPYWPPDAA